MYVWRVCCRPVQSRSISLTLSAIARNSNASKVGKELVPKSAPYRVTGPVYTARYVMREYTQAALTAGWRSLVLEAALLSSLVRSLSSPVCVAASVGWAAYVVPDPCWRTLVPLRPVCHGESGVASRHTLHSVATSLGALSLLLPCYCALTRTHWSRKVHLSAADIDGKVFVLR